jgi:hypothetical protein
LSRLRLRIARFAAPLGRAIAPVVQATDDVARIGYSQVANAGNRRLQDILGRNIERYATRGEIKRKLPTLAASESPRFRQQNAKDKLVSLIRKVRKRSGKVYYSKPQREEMVAQSAMSGAQRHIKSIADNYKGKF